MAGKIWTEGGLTVCQGVKIGGSMGAPLHWFKGCDNFTCSSRTSSVGRCDMSMASTGVGVLVGSFKMLHKEIGAAAVATVIQEKSTWCFGGNSNLESLQKINNQNGPCHCCLQETQSEKLSLELYSFRDEAQRGNG